ARVSFNVASNAPTQGGGTAVGFRDVSSLAAATASTASMVVTIPAGFTPGTYDVSAVADSGGVVTELSKSNNGRTAAGTLTVTLFQPDLTVTALTTPPTGALGRPLTLRSTVQNQGPAPAGLFRRTVYMAS